MIDVNLVLNIVLLTRTSTNTLFKKYKSFLEGTDFLNYTKNLKNVIFNILYIINVQN